MAKMGFCGELRHKAQESINGHMLGIVNELEIVLFQTHMTDIFSFFFFQLITPCEKKVCLIVLNVHCIHKYLKKKKCTCR